MVILSIFSLSAGNTRLFGAKAENCDPFVTVDSVFARTTMRSVFFSFFSSVFTKHKTFFFHLTHDSVQYLASSCTNSLPCIHSRTQSKEMLRNRKRAAEREQKHPNLTTDDPAECSVDESSQCEAGPTGKHVSPWSRPYEPPPVVSQITIQMMGIFIFVLASIWPPLVLLFAYIASKIIPYSFRVNDDATKRRKLFQEFANDDQLPLQFKTVPQHIHLEQDYWKNDRGMLLSTSIMVPKNKPIQAVVCYCHGYTDNASYTKLIENQRFIDDGIAFCTIEYEGHGLSDGPLGLINDWEKTIDDVASYFQSMALKKFHGKQVFLMGESMGSAVAFCVYQRIPSIFRGVVFVCPMCKISDDMLPPQFIIDFLIWLIGPSGTTSFLGYLPVAPSQNDLKHVTYKLPEKWEVSARCPLVFNRKPRLATARELIRVTQRISSNLHEFDAPFIVLHGKEDRVTDPMLSEALYNESKSKDKSIKLYDGMWHALMSGEPDENIEVVFRDCIEWILKRC